jgi:hypothetical protein
MKRNNCRLSEVDGEMGLRSVQKEVLETIGRYVNENKIPTPFSGGVPGDVFFTRF